MLLGLDAVYYALAVDLCDNEKTQRVSADRLTGIYDRVL